MKDRILIIGNGFDLDLGMKTSYKDFFNSRFWPFHKTLYDYSPNNYSYPQALSDALLMEKEESNWFDIEGAMGRYACHRRRDDSGYVHPDCVERAQDDKTQYEKITSDLKAYLLDVQKKTEIKTDSVAAQVFKAIIGNGYFDKIFTFNYTDLKSIAATLRVNTDFWYTHMHGSLDTEIILGIESRMEFDPLYRFMCKEYNPNYETRLLIRFLNEAEEVVIFGHSLGEIDYHYFQSFFKKQSADILTKEESKRITIFTHDTESQMDICDQLRNMNDRRLDSLYGNNILQIFRTEDCSETVQFQEFLRHLKDTSKARHHAKMESISSMIH